MRLWTSKYTELTLQNTRDDIGAPLKRFARGDTWKCRDARDNDYFKATIFGPEEADNPLLAMPRIPSTEWIEWPANSGSVFRVVNQRVVQEGFGKVVYVALVPVIGEVEIT